MKLPHHHHHHHHQPYTNETRLKLSIFLNILISASQIIAGFISGSLSLLSDAMHNFSDVVALVITLIATKLARREFTAKQTFGYKRAEIVAALINAGSLLGIAILLYKEAIVRIYDPVIIESNYVITLAFSSIIINGICVLLLQSDSHDNMNMKSAYLHLFTDMLTSIAVLFGGLAMKYYKIYWLDSFLSLLIASYLVYSSWGLLLKTIHVLMQFTPSHINISDIQEKILQIPEIKNIHHVHIWQLNDKDIHFEAHLDFHEDLLLSKTTSVVNNVSSILKRDFEINHCIIQSEIGVDDSKTLISNH